MKGVPVKFRGMSLVTRRTIYGIGVKEHDGHTDLVFDSLALEAVETDSVAQLVGYDMHGEEVFDGDTLMNMQKGSEGEIGIIRLFRDDPELFEYLRCHAKVPCYKMKGNKNG